ncbi:MAG: hypothetical protein DRI97_18915 [Bacteroidetes bacterium]|nr:MAG: hypothetical protein DRI97_18915 [Bacteroidota bacterium]
MNKAQELWLRTGGWKNVTEDWDIEFVRWRKGHTHLRIRNKDNKPFVSGFDMVFEDHGIPHKDLDTLKELA